MPALIVLGWCWSSSARGSSAASPLAPSSAAACPTTACGGCGRRSLLAGVYGGYFGAAQGVLLMAILGIGVADSMQRHNATKNVLALIVNAVAALRLHRSSPTSTGPSPA